MIGRESRGVGYLVALATIFVASALVLTLDMFAANFH